MPYRFIGCETTVFRRFTLLAKFSEQRENIKKAIGLLSDEADEIAEGKRSGATTIDIFGEE